MARQAAYIHGDTGETRVPLYVTNYSARLKNAMLSCSLMRGLAFNECFEEACVLWLKRNRYKVPEFDRREMYLKSLQILKERAKQRKAEKAAWRASHG